MEVFERKQETVSEQKKILEFIEEVKKLIEDFLRVSLEDETKMECSRNKLIDEIIQLKKQKMNNEIEKLKTQFEKEKDKEAQKEQEEKAVAAQRQAENISSKEKTEFMSEKPSEEESKKDENLI